MRNTSRFVKLEALRMLRNKRYVFFVLAFPVAFYLLYSNLWGDQTDPATGAPVSVVLMVSMAAYGALAAAMMSTAVPLAQERQSGWLRQLQATPLPGWAVIAAKLAATMLMVLPSLLLVVLAAVVTQHVTLPLGQWAGLLGAMWLGILPFAALGLGIGSLLPPDSAQPAAMICMFGLSILGGLWVPVSQLPETMRTIARVLPSYDYADIGWGIAAGHAPATASVGGIAVWAIVLAGFAVAAYRRATVRR